MITVKCNLCLNEKSEFCKVKKVKVHANKKRKCNDYIYDQSKLKIKQKIPTIRLGYLEQEESRRKAKEKLKELKALINRAPGQKAALDLGLLTTGSGEIETTPINVKYPLTGDLSRFTTTASIGDSE